MAGAIRAYRPSVMNSVIQHSLTSRLAPFLLSVIAVACSPAKAAEKSEKSASGAAPIAVTTAEVGERVLPNALTVVGSLLANRESEVAADVPGRVVAVKGERGAFVEKGSLLAQLDSMGAVLNKTAAAADVSGAAAREQHAALEIGRAAWRER